LGACWSLRLTLLIRFGRYGKIAVHLDSPYLQQIASIRKMPENTIACRTTIRRFKRAYYQCIEQLNFVPNNFFEKKKKKKKKSPGTRSPAR
jgi:hypothetical protein